MFLILALDTTEEKSLPFTIIVQYSAIMEIFNIISAEAGKSRFMKNGGLGFLLRDYILPSMKKVNPLPKLSSSNSAITFPDPGFTCL